jgi:hypothetical protein
MSPPQVLGERLGHAAQDGVARGVAVGVVDRLEMVDVDEGDAQRSFVARRALDLGEQGCEQDLSIGDAGEAVDRRPVMRVGERRGDPVDRDPEAGFDTAASLGDGDR